MTIPPDIKVSTTLDLFTYFLLFSASTKITATKSFKQVQSDIVTESSSK